MQYSALHPLFSNSSSNFNCLLSVNMGETSTHDNWVTANLSSPPLAAAEVEEVAATSDEQLGNLSRAARPGVCQG
jgi:hypothetical protein